MKIGILTFHYAFNYGALFQAVSLFDYLKSQGHDVYMVDYRNAKIVDGYKLYPSTASNKNYKFYMTLVFRLLMRFLRFRNFKHFIKENLRLINPSNLNSLDCIIVGSDQVWNTKLTAGYDSYYWGDIPFKGVIISYAASMNAVELSEDEKKAISQRLNNFSSISVREIAAQQMLSPLSNKQISMVLDPTMLNDFDYWKNRCKKRTKSERYVLAYPLRDGKKVVAVAEAIARKKGCGLKVIKGDCGWNPFTNVCNTAGPNEVLDLIKNAEFIVTSSFHGTALSILLKKSFYTIKCQDGNNVRTESVLKLLDLADRLIDDINLLDLTKTIDYNHVDVILEQERAKSRSFLNESIHG